MSEISRVACAGQWFLRSGIQEAGGGVARYYRADLERNHAISTEITGYAIRTLLDLHAATQNDEYPQRALGAARFLCRQAWDGRALPFEIDSSSNNQFAYFFDCGIVVRGLLAAWRATKDEEFLQVAASLGKSMAQDFAAADSEYYPVLKLPEKIPLPFDPLRWSQAPGCYQLKPALAWWDLFEATGDATFQRLYDRSLDRALRHYGSFLPGHPDRLNVVDRLHAFLYFLEGLLPRAAEKQCAAALCHGIHVVARFLADTAPEFERADVDAQLLRIRLCADGMGISALDVEAARREAAALAEFQIASNDPRTHGGFYFGRRARSWLPYVNPVTTTFAIQALRFWEQHQDGRPPADWRLLI